MSASAKPHWSIGWAARFIAPWEGFLPEAIGDSLAGGLPTQGYGHTRFAGKPIPVIGGPAWSKAKALRVLGHDCRGAAHSVDRTVKRRIPVRVRIALISATFNLGGSILVGTELIRAINTGQFDRAAALLERYDHDGSGNVIEGLRRRRKAEAWMLRHPRKLARNPHRPRRLDSRAARLSAQS
jgi:GH24 family phage-related lysozyme (muramidase)